MRAWGVRDECREGETETERSDNSIILMDHAALGHERYPGVLLDGKIEAAGRM